MPSKRSSFRQSWDAIKYATELCQRSFESSFIHLSPSAPGVFLQWPRRAYNREHANDDESSLVDRRWGYLCYTPSLYSVSSMSSRESTTSPSEKIPVPERSHIPEYYLPSTVYMATDTASLDTDPGVFCCATKGEIGTFIAAHPLPSPNGRKITRKFRHDWFSAYRRLFVLVFAVNMAVILAMIPHALQDPVTFSYTQASSATGANLLVATLMRQEHVINTLFRLACLLPFNAPLSVRKRAAKVYSYGALHSGCGISALLWYIFTAVLIYTRFESCGTETEFRILAGLASATLLILLSIIVLSHPYIRRAQHDMWEATHRFGGWTAIALVWAQALVLAAAEARGFDRSIAKVIVQTPVFWFLLIISACLIYPWLRLRKRRIKSEVLSSHAIRLYFDDGTLPTCVGYKLSHRPLLENHGFATISNTADEEVGYSIIVSNAGDFTKSMITNPPSHIWTRGAPVIGVMRVATLFQRIVVVATGSGIGPALSFMNVRPGWPMRVVWTARDPENTYGLEIINKVLRADRRAVIVDTQQTGHPNMPALTYAAYESFGAEAVMIVSNPAVTAKVVFEMESRGVLAFGPIFDS